MNDLNRPGRREHFAALQDDAIPTRGYRMLPLVGLGGSAGSIPALQTFFRSMPPIRAWRSWSSCTSRPSTRARWPSCSSAATAMRVVQVRETERIEADLRLRDPAGQADCRRSTASCVSTTCRAAAAAMWRSTCSSARWPTPTAARALRRAVGHRRRRRDRAPRIKERGGLTIAQDPERGRYDGMPRAAIATGMVDLVLPVAEMPRRLVELPHARTTCSGCRRKTGRAARRRRPGRDRATEATARHPRAGAHPHRPRLHALQARHRAAPHRAAHAGQRPSTICRTTSTPSARDPAKRARCCRTC